MKSSIKRRVSNSKQKRAGCAALWLYHFQYAAKCAKAIGKARSQEAKQQLIDSLIASIKCGLRCK